MKKTPLARMGKEYKKNYNAYRKFAPVFLAAHPYCEMPSETGAASCMRQAVEIHHMKGRGPHGAWLCREEWCLAVCDECHKYIENNKRIARRRGVIKYR